MQQHERADFAGLLTDVMAYYGKDVSDFLLDVWWNACEFFDMQQVRVALQKHASDPERGQFAPKVSDVVRALRGTSTDRAALAWGKVLEAMSAVGAYSDVVFDEPAIHAAIEDLGGWPKVCRADVAELSYVQHRFQLAHKAYTESGHFEYQRRLAGDRSPDYDYSSRGIPLPRPVLIGNREAAIAVLKNGSVAGKTQINTLPKQAMQLLANTTPVMELRA